MSSINENEICGNYSSEIINTTTSLVIGSRDSELAMTQTKQVMEQLKGFHPHISFKIVSMKTIGDKKLDVALNKIGSKSLFTKELEDALLDRRVDIVVHSLKDLPTTLPDDLVIGGITSREDPRDAVILHLKYKDLQGLADLPNDTIIGTSSLRRIAQLKRRYPKLKFENIRGNLNTRLAKLDTPDNYENGIHYGAIILAAAGIIRMGWKSRISEYLHSKDCMYAVGQGALAIECRENDDSTLSILTDLNDEETLMAVSAERALMRSLEGGCSVPLAVHSQIEGDTLYLKGGVWSLDGSKEIIIQESISLKLDNAQSSNGESTGTTKRCAKVARICPFVRCGLYAPKELLPKLKLADGLGKRLAKSMKKYGAKKILDEARAANVIPINAAPIKTTFVEKQQKNAMVTIS